VRRWAEEAVQLFRLHVGIEVEIQDGTAGEILLIINDSPVLHRLWSSLPRWDELEAVYRQFEENEHRMLK